MFTLFWEYMAGSIVVQAMLEEIGADYRLQYVDMGAGEHHNADFLRRNPNGRIPALGIADGQTIGETAAIVTLLGEMFPESNLTPAPGEKDRGDFLFWLNVMTTSGYMTSGRVGHPERYVCTEDASMQVGEKAREDYNAFFNVMENAISGDTYFMESGLTVLDFYLTMLTEWHENRMALFATRPALAQLCQAVNNRNSYQETIKTHALPPS